MNNLRTRKQFEIDPLEDDRKNLEKESKEGFSRLLESGDKARIKELGNIVSQSTNNTFKERMSNLLGDNLEVNSESQAKKTKVQVKSLRERAMSQQRANNTHSRGLKV